MRNAVWMLAVLAAALGPAPVVAQSYEDEVSVARVAFAAGDASYQRGDFEGWNDLRVNTPLMTGDSVYASPDGRVELELENGSVVRLDGGTQLDLLNSSGDVTQLGIGEGVLDLRMRGTSRNNTIEIDTPSAAATILERGHYLVDVSDETATYAVIRGGLSVSVDGQQLDVYEGESLEISNTDPPTYEYTRIQSDTPFQDWCDRRASRYERSTSVRYVNEQVVGCEDLDDHGSWRDVNEYGRVWVPAGVGQGWAPYQTGRWIWQDPFGWTWVSYEPWGWAPYHYGRWAYVGNYWAWVPPPPPGYRGPAAVMAIQPRYAPALVAFVGGRNWSIGVSVGGPGIGWVPLAPTERYYYPWQAPPRVVNNYRNITVINAVTVVNYNTFATEAVRPIRVAPAQIRQAPVLGPSAVVVAPTRQSLVASAAPSAVAPAPRTREARPLVARLVPPPKPKPFEQKVAEIERTGKPVVPVPKPAAVGKPFTPEAQAPAGTRVRSFSQPRGGEARRELQARPGAAARPPKPIERDIKPPPPKAQRTPATTQPAPPNDRPAPPRGNPKEQRQDQAPRPDAQPEPQRPPSDQPQAPPKPAPRGNPKDQRDDQAPQSTPQTAPQRPPSDQTAPPPKPAPRGNPKEQRQDQAPRPEAQPAPQRPPSDQPQAPPKAAPRGNPKEQRQDQAPRPEAQPAPQRPPSDQPQAPPKPAPRGDPKDQRDDQTPKAEAQPAPERPPSDQPQTTPKPEPRGKKKPKPKEKAKETTDDKPPQPPPENQD